MTDETLVPDGDDAGWDTGGWADVDEGIGSADDDTTKVTESAKDTSMLFDLTPTGAVDADTVNTVDVTVRARCDLASADSTFGVELLIGGVVQGVEQAIVPTTSWATYDLSDAAWDTDWTQAQLNGMQVRLWTRQTGMPATDLWEVTVVDVDVNYTPSGRIMSGLVGPGGLAGHGGGLVG